jgi:anti-sigma-K factor RskA
MKLIESTDIVSVNVLEQTQLQTPLWRVMIVVVVMIMIMVAVIVLIVFVLTRVAMPVIHI